MTRIPNYEQYGSLRESLQMHLSKINIHDFSLREDLQNAFKENLNIQHFSLRDSLPGIVYYKGECSSKPEFKVNMVLLPFLVFLHHWR